MGDDALLSLGDLGGGSGNFGSDVMRNGQNAVFVRVNEITRPDDDPADFDRRAEIQQMNIGVGNTDAPGEVMKTERVDFIEIADMTVGDGADAAEPFVDRGLDFAKVGPDAGRLIHILQDQDARLRNLQQAFPHFIAGGRLGRGLFRGEPAGHRITHHDTAIREQASNLRGHETFVAGPDVEDLNRIGDGGRVQIPESVESGRRVSWEGGGWHGRLVGQAAADVKTFPGSSHP